MPEAKVKPRSVHQILHQHFFRRFFDNDTLTTEGETETTVVRALAFCAVPSLMFAFWLLPSYPGPPRPYWAIEGDRYFFTMFSFVVMGVVATFEWEMLFPDKLDFLILLPMPLRQLELFYAKGKALLSFLGLFLVATNIFSGILFPAESTRKHGNFLLAIGAHFAAVLLSGICASFAVLALEGLVLCLMPLRWFRRVSTGLQCLLITTLLLLFLLYPLISGQLPMLMQGDSTFARWLPPLWFLGLDESLLQGASAPVGAWHLAQIGLYATAAVVLLALATYPLAWARQRKSALEGTMQPHIPRLNPITALLHRTLLKQPQRRAIFHFVSQTITRNTHYQVFLAIYAGVGLALTSAAVLTIKGSAGALHLALSNNGLHAILPLLLFWLVVGLRSAFAFPVDMKARWVFPINLPLAGPVFQGAAKAAKLWILLCCGLLLALVLGLLLAAKWPVWNLVVQLAWGIGLSVLMADLFFLGRTQIPFTRPRLPGRAGLPLILTLYAALFPALVLLTVKGELLAEQRGWFLLELAITAVVLHLALRFADRLALQGIIGGFPEDESEPGPQTLGLLPSTQR